MNRAKQIRLDRHLGIVDVIDGAGISARTLRKVENGQEVKTSALARLATFYAVQPSSLLQPAVFEEPNGAAA